MKYFVAIDDTDMPNTPGTGSLVQDLCAKIETSKIGICSSISRHQLFVHKDIPYTSHNSAMCFEVTLNEFDKKFLIKYCSDFVERNCSKGSDPGLCVAELETVIDEKKLMEFGLESKVRIHKKSDAYAIARTTGVHLSEHGGTGGGVIGAVAGVGLRILGNDGRYRGWYHLGNPGDILPVETLCKYDFVDFVTTGDGEILDPKENVEISSKKIKTIRQRNNQVILVYPNESHNLDNKSARYRIITKDEAKAY